MADADKLSESFDRAEQLLADAADALQAGRPGEAVGKARDACVCAVRGLCLQDGHAPGGEEELLQQFRESYVEPERVAPHWAEVVEQLCQNARQAAQGAGAALEEDTVSEWIVEADECISVLAALVEGPPQKPPRQENVHREKVVVFTALTAEEAEVRRASLAAAGIPAIVPYAGDASYHPQALFSPVPQGVDVLVDERDLQAAREVLHLADTSAATEQAATEADSWALSAARTGMFAFFLPPLALWSIYCLAKARSARAQTPPADLEAYKQNVTRGAIMATLVIVAWTLLIMLFVGWATEPRYTL